MNSVKNNNDVEQVSDIIPIRVSRNCKKAINTKA